MKWYVIILDIVKVIMNKKLYKNQMLIMSMAQQDVLTGLANRRCFGDFVKQCSPDTKFTLITLDLDHFKEVNDNFGHQTGDAALLILAEVLKLQFPEGMAVGLLAIQMAGDEVGGDPGAEPLGNQRCGGCIGPIQDSGEI